MARVGVFICWCGSNIAGPMDIETVLEAARRIPEVVHVEDNKYTCSEPGQQSIKEAIKEHGLDRVVVGSCSPLMHEVTFRRCIESAGLNPYLLEMANLREHCSWVHPDKGEATDKAIKLIEMAVAKVRRLEPLIPIRIPVERRALVLGGGIAGIQAALDISKAGYAVTLVERLPSIGGHMAQLDKTFPTLDCSACILTPKMGEVLHDENIELLTYSEVEEVRGWVGNFEVQIRKKARSVDMVKCTGCGECIEKCPLKLPSEWDLGLGLRKAIYRPFPQAVPGVPVIDREQCFVFTKGREKCRACVRACLTDAIDFEQEDEVITRRFGAIVVATGFSLFDEKAYGEYGGGQYKDVISALQFERMVNAAGPTGGHIIKPSNWREPRNVVFVQCVGSRDRAKGIPYCSKVCCMYTAKQALLLKEHLPESQAYIFCIDIRAGGKNYEEFVNRVQREYGAIYIRGRVSRIYERGDKLIVKGTDTLAGIPVEVEADLVVLATAIASQSDSPQLARILSIPYDEHGFFSEAHPKLRPVESVTRGIFLAGACQSPKDIPDSVATAGAAAVRVCELFASDELALEPEIAVVDPLRCNGCLLCTQVCPFSAVDSELTRDGRRIAVVNESACKGCGLCVAACRPGAVNLRGFTDQQLLAEVMSLWR